MPLLPYTRIEHLRLLLIVFVVLIHARPQRVMVALPSPVSVEHFIRSVIFPGVTAVAVPMFALVAGFLFFFDLPFRADRYSAKIRRRIHTLGVPYLLCSAGNLAVLLLLQNVDATRPLFTRDPDFILTNFGPGEIAYRLFIHPIPVQLWFLRDLIVLIILSPIIGAAIRYFHWWAVLPFLGAWLANNTVNYEQRLFVSTMTIAFFMAGACIAMHAPSVAEAAPRGRRILLLVWLISAIVGASRVLPPIPSQINASLGVFLGIAALWCNADLLSRLLEWRALRWIAQTSFFIFLAHQPLLRVLERFAARISLIAQRNELFLFLVLPAITILICAGTAVAMKRFTPLAYRLMTGDR